MKNNIPNIILLVLLSSIIAFFSISYIFVSAKSFSEEENRALQTPPRFTVEKLLDGTYTRQLHDYYSDQINLRTLMVELKASFELLMGKNENNGVLLGKDGYLIETHSYTEENYKYLKNNLAKIEKLMSTLKENGMDASSVLIPRKVDILNDYLPPYYSTERNEQAWELVGSAHITLTEALKAEENTFYKTDHHWTDRGAYIAYRELGKVLGYSPKSYSTFDVITLSDSFLGTTYSTSGFFFTSPEEIKSPNVNADRYKTEIVDIEFTFDGPYDESYLAKKDKYSTFLSGNNAHVKIYDTQGEDKPTILIIKDSYSHSLVPYLCERYNIELIDPRYFTGSIEDYILENEFDSVLFLFGLDTLASANLSIR